MYVWNFYATYLQLTYDQGLIEFRQQGLNEIIVEAPF